MRQHRGKNDAVFVFETFSHLSFLEKTVWASRTIRAKPILIPKMLTTGPQPIWRQPGENTPAFGRNSMVRNSKKTK